MDLVFWIVMFLLVVAAVNSWLIVSDDEIDELTSKPVRKPVTFRSLQADKREA
jgi:hypothetical protein